MFDIAEPGLVAAVFSIALFGAGIVKALCDLEYSMRCVRRLLDDTAVEVTILFKIEEHHERWVSSLLALYVQFHLHGQCFSLTPIVRNSTPFEEIPSCPVLVEDHLHIIPALPAYSERVCVFVIGILVLEVFPPSLAPLPSRLS